jgi:hypothetical protein
VKKDEKALEYASDELQNDPEVIDAAKMWFRIIVFHLW